MPTESINDDVRALGGTMAPSRYCVTHGRMATITTCGRRCDTRQCWYFDKDAAEYRPHPDPEMGDY